MTKRDNLPALDDGRAGEAPASVPAAFSALFLRRWAPPILAELRKAGGLRFVQLANRLDLSRDTLSATLNELVERGWIVRNAGYGHPLRPEYLPAPGSEELGEACRDFLSAAQSIDAGDVALRRWSMPALLAIDRGARRFNDLKRALDGVTPRALSQSLQLLESPPLVARVAGRSDLATPSRPAGLIELAPKGLLLAAKLAPLAAAADSLAPPQPRP